MQLSQVIAWGLVVNGPLAEPLFACPVDSLQQIPEIVVYKKETELEGLVLVRRGLQHFPQRVHIGAGRETDAQRTGPRDHAVLSARTLNVWKLEPKLNCLVSVALQ